MESPVFLVRESATLSAGIRASEGEYSVPWPDRRIEHGVGDKDRSVVTTRGRFCGQGSLFFRICMGNHRRD